MNTQCPKTITFDYGENMVEVTDNLKDLYNKTITINYTGCPSCNCFVDSEVVDNESR